MSQKKISKNISSSAGNIPVVASIIVLIAFIAGLLLGTLMVAKSVGGAVGSVAGTFTDGYNAAKKKLADSGLVSRISTGAISGTITKISGNEVSFSAALINPLDDESLKNRVAVIAGDTVITLYREKSAEKMAADQKELAGLQSQQAALLVKNNACGPRAEGGNDCDSVRQAFNTISRQIGQKTDSYEKVDNAKLSDLKEGMQITVYGREVKAEAGANPSGREDISALKKINAGAINAREVITAPRLAAPSASSASTTPSAAQ